jgi:hypothetical protein
LASNGDAQGPTAFTPWRSLLPRLFVESLLIVLSVLLALGVNQWQDSRRRKAQAAVALQSIQAELEANRESVSRARNNHLSMKDSLQSYTQRRETLPERIYLGGVFKPAATYSTAWDSARETGVTTDLPFQLVLALSRVYDRQARYRALGEALGQDLMMQVRREGFEPVLRDRPASLMALEEDFANRESVLLQGYDSVLDALKDRTR